MPFMFSSDCNVTIKGYRGAIELLSVMKVSKCRWTIVAPKGSKVNMTFISLKNTITAFKPYGFKFHPRAHSNCNSSILTVSAQIFG